MRYRINRPLDGPPWIDLIDLDEYDGDHVHLLADDDLGHDRHFCINDDNWDGYVERRESITHVAIPIDQYVRIFGEP